MKQTQWEEFWQDVSVYTAWGWVVGALVVLFALFKLWPFIRRSFKIIDAILLLPALVDSVATVVDDVATVKHEVMPNGGDSLADKVNDLTGGQEHIKRQNASLKTTVARVDRAARATQEKLDEHISLAASNRVDDQRGDR